LIKIVESTSSMPSFAISSATPADQGFGIAFREDSKAFSAMRTVRQAPEKSCTCFTCPCHLSPWSTLLFDKTRSSYPFGRCRPNRTFYSRLIDSFVGFFFESPQRRARPLLSAHLRDRKGELSVPAMRPYFKRITRSFSV
jgi:hypothetical protein